ncbi:MAG: LysR substrate-binding domain-containing protein [Rhodospirillales bacterium]|nr:LysR substrate-binding domain-containing protein [Rhodospirillales bacterium]
MDKIRALRYFLKVAETASFTKAAKTFSVPASSVSRRIRDLESELRVELFHRSTRIVKLSALGQVYYEQVKDIVSALDYADELVSQRSKVPSGVLRITAMPGYGTARLLPALEKLHVQYPEIILDVELTDQVTDIARDQVDIAIRASSNLPDRAVAKKLSDNEFVLIASPEYLEQNGVPLKADDLLAHKTLLYRGPNGILHWQAKTKDVWRELKTSPVYISNDGSALVQAALTGQGIALLPKWGVIDNLNDKSLIELNMEEDHVSVARVSESGIYLLYLKPRYNVLKIKAAVDFLVTELSQGI